MKNQETSNRHNCETCKFRGYYERRPGSILGRLWKWHIGWCPGWKKYYSSLSDEEKSDLQHRLNQHQ